jgi:hypothetical protein
LATFAVQATQRKRQTPTKSTWTVRLTGEFPTQAAYSKDP